MTRRLLTLVLCGLAVAGAAAASVSVTPAGDTLDPGELSTEVTWRDTGSII
jgi:hypothetical protein